MSRRVMIWVVAALSASFPITALGGSYVGLFEDPAGLQPCISVPPATAKTLYVIAKVDGVVASGLTGAEFRIEFDNATGWFASYVPLTTANIVMGDPVDVDPDPNVGGGLNLAFPTCQAPLNGMVALGTVSVFNNGGSSTNLNVKRHSQPTNPNFPCPLLTVCDSSFSAVCMESGEAASCSTLTSKSEREQAVVDDPAVFRLGLNHTVAPPVIPPGSTFSDTVAVASNAELWVMGTRIHESVVSCAYDGGHIRVAGIALQPFAPPPPSDDEILLSYGSIPRFRQCRDQGMSMAQAQAVVASEINALPVQATAQYKAGGDAALRQFLEASPLVASVTDVSHGYARIRLHGRRGEGGLSCARQFSTATKRESARSILETLRSTMRHRRDKIIFVMSSGVSWLGGDAMEQARGQLDYVNRMHTTDGLPSGPLPPRADTFRAMIQEYQEGGERR